MSLGAWGHLGTTLGSQRLTCAFQASILEDFSSKWELIWSPKITLRVSRGVSELAMMCFRRGFFRTYILHQIKYPKLIQKDVFVGPLDMAET